MELGFGGNSAVFTIRVSTQTSLSDSFLSCGQLLLFHVLHPSWWYANITLDTVGLGTPQRLAVLNTDAPARHTPTICPLSSSDMSPITLCGLQCLIYICAVALIQLSHSTSQMTDYILCTYTTHYVLMYHKCMDFRKLVSSGMNKRFPFK